MKSQPQSPEFRNNPENFHQCLSHCNKYQIPMNDLVNLNSPVKEILLACFSLIFHQQLRSYADGASALSLIQQTGEVCDHPAHPAYKAIGLSTTHSMMLVCMLSFPVG